MSVSDIATLITELGVLGAAVLAAVVWIRRVIRGQLCQLRSEMLRTYYHNHDNKTIRQFEYENFVMLYEAYHALKGNSFIDKIYEEVKSWEVIT